MMVKYEKPFLSIMEQINLLKERGLIIGDEEKAIFFLSHISYYHLSIYAKAFQNSDNQFMGNIKFEDVLDLYNFDKKLRLLLSDILERIEMSFKCVLAYKITESRKDNYWYIIEKNNYPDKEKIKDLLNEVKNSKEIHIEHFYAKYYESEYLPAWIFFETLTFGECSLLARNLSDEDKQIVAGFYKLSKKSTIQMLHHLSHLRNLCAHHSRIWNRNFTMQIAEYPKYIHVYENCSRNSFYAYLIATQIFMSRINPNSSWLDELQELIKEYNIPINKMGFPNNWYDKLKSIK